MHIRNGCNYNKTVNLNMGSILSESSVSFNPLTFVFLLMPEEDYGHNLKQRHLIFPDTAEGTGMDM